MDDIFDKVGVRDKHINKGLRQVAAAGFTFPSKRQFGRFLTLKAQVNGIAIPPSLLSKSKECKNYMDCGLLFYKLTNSSLAPRSKGRVGQLVKQQPTIHGGD